MQPFGGSAVATRGMCGPSRAGCARCAGGEPSGHMGHLIALAAPRHQAVELQHKVTRELGAVVCPRTFHRV